MPCIPFPSEKAENCHQAELFGLLTRAGKHFRCLTALLFLFSIVTYAQDPDGIVKPFTSISP